MLKYLISGGTSELGTRVVRGLVKHSGNDNVVCLVRKTSNVASLERLGVGLRLADVAQPDSYLELLGPSVTYLDMTHPKYYATSLGAVKTAGVHRAFFVTTTGIFSSYNHCSEIYRVNERRIKDSGINYTILRPSLIYGTERDRNMTRLLRMLDRVPVFPVFGAGACLMQPVYVQDLADGIVAAVVKESVTRRKEYNLCGPTAISYIELLRTACQALGRRVHFIHVPLGLAVLGAAIGEKIPGFPIKKEQVQRLAEDKAFDITEAQKDLGYVAREYSDGIQLQVAHLRAHGLL